ncbi:MAG TPA: isoprenylcysteine carboxylmethyltransferase family protein [Bacteroidales bacterium]|nr:isoprenylcysteine carboxylmethyltransferase family protein [Bacteroidales bacterium]
MPTLSITVLISFIFFISEMTLMITMHSKKKTVVTRKDRGTMILLWVMICLSLTIGFNIAARMPWTDISVIFAIAGYVVMLIGFIIRWTAIIQLRKAFTVDVSFSEGQELKSDGLYKNIRHPSYLGLLSILFGLSLGMGNIWSVLVVTIPMLFTINYRILVEEKLLMEEFGDAYSQYKSHTRRLIPGIY